MYMERIPWEDEAEVEWCIYKPGNTKEAGREAQKILPDSLEGTNPAHTLISDFQPPELWDNNYLFLIHPVCGA
jgi:hypothetical protein